MSAGADGRYGRSGALLDAQESAGGVAHVAVAQAVVLVEGLLDDVGPGRLESGEGRVEVLGGEGGVGGMESSMSAPCSR